jgi:L-ascorbate metabolism protein UlaG (beta-lactamase superfamily)
MHITHLGHAAVLVETDTSRVLVDPGIFSKFDELTDLDAVVVTHAHFDHLDVDRLPALLAANPKVKIAADVDSAKTISGLGFEVSVLSARDEFLVGNDTITTVGGAHAVIHQDLPFTPNVGLVFNDGAFYHPGDSLFVPEQDIDVLGTPISGPWFKVSEGVDFFRAVLPRVAVPIHEGSTTMAQLHHDLLRNLSPTGSIFTVLEPGEKTSL